MKFINRSCLTGFVLLFSSLGLATAAVGQNNEPQRNRNVPTAVQLRASEVSVPMERYANKPIVQATINGKGPFKFFLDTGAGATVINKDLVNELNLPVVGETRIGDPANPQGITAQQVMVERLEIGGAHFLQTVAITWDRSALYGAGSPRGVLGLPLFADLLLTLNYPQSNIVISRGQLPAANQKDVLSYQPSEGGLFTIPVSIAGKEFNIHVDSGSPSPISLPKRFAEQLPLASPLAEIGRGRTVNGEFVIFGAKLNGVAKLGGYEFQNPEMVFNERLPVGLIGHQILRRFALTLDQKNRRIRFTESPTAAAPSPPPTTGSSAPGASEYAGRYGQRTIFAEGSVLYLQRDGGPKLKLVHIDKDEYGLEEVPEARIRFIRDASGNIIELNVLNRAGEWEKAKRG